MQDADRLFFLEKLAMLCEEMDVEVFLICLMDNHFHLCLRQSELPLSKFMQRLQTSYAVYFNNRHERSGHVVQGRYRSHAVLDSRYLLQLSRYVHLNPVMTQAYENASLKQKISALRAYPWSSYRGYLGLSVRHPFIRYETVLNFCQSDKESSVARYQRFVENGLRFSRFHLRRLVEDPGIVLRGPAAREAFRVRPSAPPPLDPNGVLRRCSRFLQCRMDHLALPHYFVTERTMTAMMLMEYAKLTQTKAARMLGWKTNAALSIQMKRLSLWIQKDPSLQDRLKMLRSALDEDRDGVKK